MEATCIKHLSECSWYNGKDTFHLNGNHGTGSLGSVICPNTWSSKQVYEQEHVYLGAIIYRENVSYMNKELFMFFIGNDCALINVSPIYSKRYFYKTHIISKLNF